jgi:hypothetical protein
VSPGEPAISRSVLTSTNGSAKVHIASAALECRCVTSRAGGSGRPRSQSHSVGNLDPKMQGLMSGIPTKGPQ